LWNKKFVVEMKFIFVKNNVGPKIKFTQKISNLLSQHAFLKNMKIEKREEEMERNGMEKKRTFLKNRRKKLKEKAGTRRKNLNNMHFFSQYFRLITM